VTVLIKGLLEMLGLFYNNNKGFKRGEESKQFIKSRSSSELGHMILTLIPAMLGINNF